MAHGMGSENFVENQRRALENPQLQRAMTKATEKFVAARVSLEADGGAQWGRLRDRAREIKEHTVAHLDHYLDEFAANVERLGGHVCWAADAEAANRYITDLARRRGVRLAVKGKSMMSEEVGLNAALAEAGVEPVETDLGEHIVQLAGERPSHINMPAVHKTRGDIAELFAEKLHAVRTEGIDDLTALARRLLRERFAAAGMGITGVNFAVAETGTIVLIENEGNIRLTTSLPRVHVALMGIEKVLPRFEDLEVFLKLLPRSASGQKLTAGVSFLTGVKGDAGEEGPEEFHVVIIDNGRTEILANPHLRESLLCIRCGACLNACPVYQKIGGHAYGWVYPGPIGAVLTPQLIGRTRAAQLPFASSLCGACKDACPIKINIPEMLLHLRHEIKEGSGAQTGAGVSSAPGGVGASREVERVRPAGFRQRLGGLFERAAFKLWAATMRDARRYRIAGRLARIVQRVFGSRDAAGVFTLPVARWTKTRQLPPLAPRPFSSRWPEISETARKEPGR